MVVAPQTGLMVVNAQPVTTSTNVQVVVGAPTDLSSWKNPRRASIKDEAIVEAFDSLESHLKELLATVP